MVVTLRQIAEKRKITYRAVKKRRDREDWHSDGKRLINYKRAEVFHINSLPEDLRVLFSANSLPVLEPEAEIYSSAPEWARKKADRYLSILKASADLKGEALRQFITQWNVRHLEFKTSYPRVVEARRVYREQGISGILAGYGKSAGKSIVSDELFRYFKAAYLKEGATSVMSCWLRTLGFAKGIEPQTTVKSFPSPKSFIRRLEREVPKNAIYLARHGREAWNRKYGNYIDRDYTNLRPGECLVSDHAQVDVAVLLPGGKVCFPWVTAWRDFKTGKWLSWLHHPEAPNSDHVFQTFYNAALEHGLSSDVYIDNGKDYRCRDFAGGRRSHRISIDEPRTVAALGMLDITARFALPRNAQAKAIERDFLRNKEWFSKHMPGYRGGNVKERPEKLKTEIRSGKILGWDEYVTLLDTFIKDVLNRMPSYGKVHKGMSPDELWEMEKVETRRVSPDSLKLLCMRTSRPLTIGRNGVRDSEMGVTYWGEWMSGIKCEKVYLRRDVKAYQEAWVFMATDDEYIGKAYIAEQAAALARTDIEKARLRELLARKRQEEKVIKAFAKIKDSPTPAEILGHMVSGVEALNGRKPTARRRRLQEPSLIKTRADSVMNEALRMENMNGHDLKSIMPSEREKRPALFLSRVDKEIHEEASHGGGNGKDGE